MPVLCPSYHLHGSHHTMAGAVLALEKAHDDDEDDDNTKSESKFPIEGGFKVFEKQNLFQKILFMS